MSSSGLLNVVPLVVTYGITKAILDDTRPQTHYCKVCKKSFGSHHEASIHSHVKSHKVHKMPKRLSQ